MNKIISLVVLLVFLVGCGGEDTSKIDEESNNISTTEKGDFSSAYYGKWLRVDTKEEVNILYSTVIPNHEIKSDNLIKITQDDTSYYLMRAGLSNIIVSGTIVEDETTLARSVQNIGNVNVILQNVLDKDINTEKCMQLLLI